MGKKEEREGDKLGRVFTELEITKASYIFQYLSFMRNMIFYENIQFEMRKFILIYTMKVFFGFGLV